MIPAELKDSSGTEHHAALQRKMQDCFYSVITASSILSVYMFVSVTIRAIFIPLLLIILLFAIGIVMIIVDNAISKQSLLSLPFPLILHLQEVM